MEAYDGLPAVQPGENLPDPKPEEEEKESKDKPPPTDVDSKAISGWSSDSKRSRSTGWGGH